MISHTPPPTPLGVDYRMDLVTAVVLSMVTCGIYMVYWKYRQFEAMNILLGRMEYNFVTWLLLSVVTCGIWAIYIEYKQGQDLDDCVQHYTGRTGGNLGVIALVLVLCGLGFVNTAMFQNEINRLVNV